MSKSREAMRYERDGGYDCEHRDEQACRAAGRSHLRMRLHLQAAALLRRLLDELSRQETGGLFTFSVVIADNDEKKSAEPVADAARSGLGLVIKYCMEPRQNIALARNKVVENADGDYLAFIDDDEFPCRNWLLTLFKTCRELRVDGVLGPVLRHFDQTPPKWLEKSNFYVRRVNPTGMRVEWLEARTGNVLLKRELVAGDPAPFRPEFAPEKVRLFRRKIAEGAQLYLVR